MIHITQATLDDLEELSVLFDGYRMFYKRESDVQAGAQFLATRIRNNESVIFLARDAQGKAAGFTQLYPIFASTRLQRNWLLNDLYVDPAFRGQGISVALLDRAKQLARETQAVGVVLETEKTNDIGNALYPRAGFTLDEEHNFYYWLNE